MKQRSKLVEIKDEYSRVTLGIILLTNLYPMHPFSTLRKQGVKKGCIGNKWVNMYTEFSGKLTFLTLHMHMNLGA